MTVPLVTLEIGASPSVLKGSGELIVPTNAPVNSVIQPLDLVDVKIRRNVPTGLVLMVIDNVSEVVSFECFRFLRISMQFEM